MNPAQPTQPDSAIDELIAAHAKAQQDLSVLKEMSAARELVLEQLGREREELQRKDDECEMKLRSARLKSVQLVDGIARLEREQSLEHATITAKSQSIFILKKAIVVDKVRFRKSGMS